MYTLAKLTPMCRMTCKRMFIIACLEILKIWKQSERLGQWKSSIHFIAVSLPDPCIKKDDLGNSMLNKKNQIVSMCHLHTCLKHTKQYCLLLMDSSKGAVNA